LSDLLTLFSNNILPIFLAAGAGYALARYLKLNPRTLSTVIFYIFSPCLVFTLIRTSQLGNGDILRMIFFTTTLILLLGGITLLIGRLMRLEKKLLAAALLSTMFMNAGNFGLSVVLFAFGENSLAYSSLFFVTSSVLINTVGVMTASLGSANLRQALSNLVKLPALYALILGFVFLETGWILPAPVERATQVLGNAAIPGMLVLLGMQLQIVQWKGFGAPLTLVNVMRLIVSPLIAIGLAQVFNLSGHALQAGVLESAMPSAVLNIVVATEFDARPEFVTAAVTTTTLFSALTLTLWLAYLGG
jgi:malate permease and related proteins